MLGYVARSSRRAVIWPLFAVAPASRRLLDYVLDPETPPNAKGELRLPLKVTWAMKR